MPLFNYTGYKSDGSGTTGVIEADGVQDAASEIRALGIYPRDIRPHTDRKTWQRRRNEAALLPVMTRQLSTLLSAGVPLLEALKSLSDENTGFWKTMLVNIRENVSAGSSLSRALIRA